MHSFIHKFYYHHFTLFLMLTATCIHQVTGAFLINTTVLPAPHRPVVRPCTKVKYTTPSLPYSLHSTYILAGIGMAWMAMQCYLLLRETNHDRVLLVLLNKIVWFTFYETKKRIELKG